ncbi:MAG: hypothetical protein J6G98_00945 [Bacilli bacterium]|nr:hypothetical protein [Bacilli bacterium]
MILRKPYAILIKNFKIIHLILSVLMLYLLYKTYNILAFFNSYLNTIATTISNEITRSLFGVLPIIVSIGIIVGSLIIFALMKFKDKPVKTYLYSIISYIAFIVYYIVTFSIVKSLELNLVDVRTLKILRDLTTVALIVESIAFIIVLIRSTGFDIKSFNFKKDLEDLNVEVEDSEEFEVNTEIDTSKLKRTFNKKVRHLKYAYFENKLLLNIIAVIIILLFGGLFYYNKAVVNRKYKQNEYMTTSRFLFNFTNSYLTKYDYKNNILSENTELVIIKFKVKTLYGYSNIGLGAFQLNVDGYKYHHKMDLKDSVFDLGVTFNDQRIKPDYQDFILVFEIPSSKENSKMKLKYFDYLKTYEVNIKPQSLNNIKESKSANIADELVFDDSVLNNASIKIESAEINRSFKSEYQTCPNNKCSTYYEYIVPSTNNGAEYLLKIDGVYKNPDANEKINTLYKFIKTFGKIKYLDNGTYKTMDIGINQVKPRMSTSSSIYLELTEEASNKEHIIIEFNVRGKLYTYSVK